MFSERTLAHSTALLLSRRSFSSFLPKVPPYLRRGPTYLYASNSALLFALVSSLSLSLSLVGGLSFFPSLSLRVVPLFSFTPSAVGIRRSVFVVVRSFEQCLDLQLCAGAFFSM